MGCIQAIATFISFAAERHFSFRVSFNQLCRELPLQFALLPFLCHFKGTPADTSPALKSAPVRRTKGAKSEVSSAVSFWHDCKVHIFRLQQRRSSTLSSRMPRRQTVILSPESTLFAPPAVLPPGTHSTRGEQDRCSIPYTQTSHTLRALPFAPGSKVLSFAVPIGVAAHTSALQRGSTPASTGGRRAADPAGSASTAASMGRASSSPQDQCKRYSGDGCVLGPAPTLTALLLELLELRHQCS